MKESTRDKLAIFVQILFTIPISFIIIDNNTFNTLKLTDVCVLNITVMLGLVCLAIQYLIWRKK